MAKNKKQFFFNIVETLCSNLRIYIIIRTAFVIIITVKKPYRSKNIRQVHRKYSSHILCKILHLVQDICL